MDKTALGNRMKGYEAKETQRTFMPYLPLIARLDGRGFSKFTKGMERPYDEDFSGVMQDLTKFLVQEFNVKVGYTQSDEITLVWNETSEDMLFGTRVFKLTSTLAAVASVKFNRLFYDKANLLMLDDSTRDKGRTWFGKWSTMPTFDCRVFQVPNETEAANCLLWRELDATKNSVAMAAQSMFSHKSLQNLNSKEMQDKMMLEKNVNWNDYPDFFKRGTYFKKVQMMTKFSSDELERLPEKHEAKLNPDLEVQRYVIEKLDLKPLPKLDVFERLWYLF